MSTGTIARRKANLGVHPLLVALIAVPIGLVLLGLGTLVNTTNQGGKIKVAVISYDFGVRNGLVRGIPTLEGSVQVTPYPSCEAAFADLGNFRLNHAAVVTAIMGSQLRAKTGIQCCREITETFPQMKVFVLSHYPGDEALAMEAGADFFLDKSFSISELVEIIFKGLGIQ